MPVPPLPKEAEWLPIDAIRPLETACCLPSEQHIEDAVRQYRDTGILPPIVADPEGRIYKGLVWLEAAKVLQLERLPVIRRPLTARQKKLCQIAERAELSGEFPPVEPGNILAQMNDRSRRFWAGKRDIPAAILRDPDHNARFSRLLRFEGWKPIRRQRSDYELTTQALLDVALQQGARISVPRSAADEQKEKAARTRSQLRNRARNLDQARQKLDVETQARRAAAKERSLKGGKARKADPLQRLIEELVRRDLNMTVPKLFSKILRFSYSENQIILRVDEEEGIIYFDMGPRREGKAKISGLKHRLSRAKKFIRDQSRKAG